MLTPNFTSTESLSSPSNITFTDTSTGSDSNVINRRIYVALADGTFLVPSGTTTSYINWSYSDSSITLNLISKSQAANVTVIWSDGTTDLYTKTILMEWDLYDYLFLFYLLQVQTSQPSIINDTNYYNNCLIMIVNLFNSENAVLLMDDLYSSQGALDKNFYMMNKQPLFF